MDNLKNRSIETKRSYWMVSHLICLLWEDESK